MENLEFLKKGEDIRGLVIFMKYGIKMMNLVETKKGFARGGHYHNFSSTHFLLSGKITFKTMNLATNQEQIREYFTPCEIIVEPNIAHLLIAETNCIFVESFDEEYSATDYMPYRDIINKQF